MLLGEESSRTVVLTLPFVRVDWLFLHQATFAVWATVSGLHLIGRLVPALQVVRRSRRRVPGRARRLLAAATVIAVAVPLAVLITHAVDDWRSEGRMFHPDSSSGP